MKLPDAKQFKQEVEFCIMNGRLTETMGKFIMDIIHYEIYYGKILKGYDNNIKYELKDTIIMYSLERFDAVLYSDTPKAYFYAMVRNAIRNYKQRTLINKSTDIYGKSLLIKKDSDRKWLKATFQDYDRDF